MPRNWAAGSGLATIFRERIVQWDHCRVADADPFALTNRDVRGGEQLLSLPTFRTLNDQREGLESPMHAFDNRQHHGSLAAEPAPHSLSQVEFVCLMAVMMALTALSIDLMLPALPAIGDAMGITDPNDRQIVIIGYLLGFSIGQLGYGRLSDSFGRKPVLMVGLAIFVAGSLAASLSSSFWFLIVARMVQGFGAAAPRVIAIAVVRDLYVGRNMARIMSFAMMTFITIPVLAPALGQGLLEVGTWRWTFDALLVAGLGVALWAAIRLPETHAEPVDGAERLGLGAAIKMVFETPQTIGYAIGVGFLFGCLMSYISSAQQVFVDVYHLGADFPLVFGAIAAMMAVAALVNAGLVERLGMRRVSHSALTGFIVVAAALVVAVLTNIASLLLFSVLAGILFFLIGLILPNFNALAMEPQGDNAGMASSVIGFLSTGAGALFGGIVGHQFDGTVLPMTLGLLFLSLGSFVTVLYVEGLHGLFRKTH